MATATFVQRGSNIDYTPAKDLEYMEIIPLVSRLGVALEPIAKGETGTVALKGAYEMPAATGAIEVGTQVYFNTDDENITTTATEGKTIPAGIVVEPKASADTTAIVQID